MPHLRQMRGVIEPMKAYNHLIPQRALKHISPIQALKHWHAKKPALFKKRVYNQLGLDSYFVERPE